MKRLFLTAAALLISVNAAYADGENKIGKTAKIKRPEAEAIALKKVPGTVLDADIEKRKSGLFWDIKIKPTDGAEPWSASFLRQVARASFSDSGE